MATSQHTKRKWFQFGLGTLLFMTLCVAGYLSGYRQGVSAGQVEKKNATPYFKAYNIRAIVSDMPNADKFGGLLCNYIRATITPASWRENGGLGSLEYQGKLDTIIVFGVQDVQDQVAGTLEQIRHLPLDRRAKDIEDALASAKN